MDNVKKNKKVIIGMSGGVDSSVSALLLKEQGYEVVGITMRLCTNDEEKTNKMISDAKEVCNKIGIEHQVADFTSEFNKYVVNNFISMYKDCMTPNPCIECNKHLKFGAMYKLTKELGADYIATGHYADIEYNEQYERYAIKKIDSTKDQSYFLYGIDKEVIEHILFPLAKYESKDEIRKIASDNGLIVANKPDSQDICFIPDGNYARFLEEEKKVVMPEGNVVHVNGEIIGKHKGLHRYTIGQRKGLGIAYKEPIYVVGMDSKKNELIVGSEKELESKVIYAKDINLVLVDEIQDGLKVKAKIRFNKSLEDAILYNEESRIRVEFKNSVLRATPGQSVVFYIDDYVLGGGIISKVK